MLHVFNIGNQEIQGICETSEPSPVPQSVSTPMSGRSTPANSPRPMISMEVISILRQIIAVFNPSDRLLPKKIFRYEVNVESKREHSKLKTRELFIYDKILVGAGQSEVRGACWTGNKVHKPYLLLTPKVLPNGRRMYSERELSIHMSAASSYIAPKLYPCRKEDGSFLSSRNSLIRLANRGDLLLYFSNNKLEMKPLVEITINMAMQVYNLHYSGIYHRDIKPENFLAHQVSEGFVHIFLTDYGLATRNLKFHDKKGTKGYCPPEYSSFENPYDGIAADKFGLGATLFGVLVQKSLDGVYEVEYQSKFSVDDTILDYDAFAIKRDREIEELIEENINPAESFRQAKNALKGLLKTRASDRISIEEAIRLLEETLACL